MIEFDKDSGFHLNDDFYHGFAVGFLAGASTLIVVIFVLSILNFI